MARNPHFHCRSDAQRFMNAAKVVIGEVKAQRRPMVLKLFREGIREASQASDLHSHG